MLLHFERVDALIDTSPQFPVWRACSSCLHWETRATLDFWARDSKLDALTDLKVAQRTPLRVAHRRTGLVREKVIHSMSSELVSSRIFILDMDTSAGTYVKEFVHGDLGATQPLITHILLCAACCNPFERS